jgi:mono/diheme cytochrome c family protein
MRKGLQRFASIVLLTTLVACSVPEGKQWAAKKRARATQERAQERAQELARIPPGEPLFAENCLRCHSLLGKGGTIGPDLSKIGARRDDKYLEEVIRRPSHPFPGTVMPAFDNLSQEELRLLVDYLLSLK